MNKKLRSVTINTWSLDGTVKEQCWDKIGEINAFSVIYEKLAMLVTMSPPPADRSMFEQQ